MDVGMARILLFELSVLASIWATGQGKEGCVFERLIAYPGKTYTFHSPGFLLNQIYPRNLKCKDLIRSEDTSGGLTISILEMNLDQRVAGICQDSLIFYEGRTKTNKVLAELCGNEKTSFETESPFVLVTFTSDNFQFFPRKGFSFEYKALNKTYTAEESDSDGGDGSKVLIFAAVATLVAIFLAIFVACWVHKRCRKQAGQSLAGETEGRLSAALSNASPTDNSAVALMPVGGHAPHLTRNQNGLEEGNHSNNNINANNNTAANLNFPAGYGYALTDQQQSENGNPNQPQTDSSDTSATPVPEIVLPAEGENRHSGGNLGSGNRSPHGRGHSLPQQNHGDRSPRALPSNSLRGGQDDPNRHSPHVDRNHHHHGRGRGGGNYNSRNDPARRNQPSTNQDWFSQPTYPQSQTPQFVPSSDSDSNPISILFHPSVESDRQSRGSAGSGRASPRSSGRYSPNRNSPRHSPRHSPHLTRRHVRGPSGSEGDTFTFYGPVDGVNGPSSAAAASLPPPPASTPQSNQMLGPPPSYEDAATGKYSPENFV